jgi:hypothetical protein
VFGRLIFTFSLALSLAADDHWVGMKSGQFEVLTNGSEKSAREKLMFLAQFGEALRQIAGKDELRVVWPVRVLVFKNAKQLPGVDPHFALGRDARMLAVTEADDFSRDVRKELARILLFENTSRLPDEIEQGIIELLSTLEVEGPKITVGAPVPEVERSYGWAFMQLVTVNPAYSGRSRVLVSNLEQSGDYEAACRNAFEKSAAQMKQQAEAYLKGGSFPTGSMSGRALSLTRDFKPANLSPEDVKIALADLLFAAGSDQAEAAYAALNGVKADEGSGLIAVKAHKDEEARKRFESATDADSKNARAWLELGQLEAGPARAVADYKKAAELNPRWGEPYFHMADEEDNPDQRVTLLKKAANLDVRNFSYWEVLARAEIFAKNYPEAQKAWAGAERAANTDEERARIHKVRLDVEQDRGDYEAAERKRIREEREQDIARVKAQSEAAIRAAEEAANKKLNPNGAAQRQAAVWMDELKGGASVEGVFARLDCVGSAARMVIQTDEGKTVQLLIRDPAGVALSGGGEKTFGCGVQSSLRRVRVEFNAKTDAKLHTTGEATTIEFR